MCGRYALTTPADLLAKFFEATTAITPQELPPRYNVAPTQMAPVVRAGREGGRSLDLLRWGLVPFWSKEPQSSLRTINARCESAAESRLFGSALCRRRCLVPADGFFEWKKLERGKQPYFIHGATGGPLALAGLWERWRGAHETIDSFTILTTEANQAVRPLHDRMPLILAPGQFDLWLDRSVQDPHLLAPLFRPAADELLGMYPVSSRVNSPQVDEPAILEPVAEEGEGPQRRGADDQPTLF